MPEMKSYESGQFCWIDLATTDVDAAKAFCHSVARRSRRRST